MNIFPVGNKIMVRRIKEQSFNYGIVLSDSGESKGNAWGEIIALPKATTNIWIETMKIGDKVLYKRFEADSAVNKEHDQDFEIIDIETNDGNKAGQVLAHEPKVNE